ncbi:MAG: hypothetical protein AAF501_18405, partial [Pseudomonadota bacterium]
ELKTEQVRILRDAAEEDDARGAALAFESEIETLQAQVEHERAELRALRRSPSWRITAPLRSLIKRFHKLSGGKAGKPAKG